MKTNVRVVQLFIVLGAVWLTCAFDCGGSKGNEPVTTMHIFSQNTYYENGILVAANPVRYQDLSGHQMYDLTGAKGSVYAIPPGANTGFAARYSLPNARIPAHWSLDLIWDPVCGATQDEHVEADINPTDGFFLCRHDSFSPFASNSARFSLYGATPSTITLGGVAPFTTANGMPNAGVFDRTGNLIANLTATTVSPDGTTATFPFPTNNGTALSADIYSIGVANQTSGGVMRNLGSNFMTVGGTTTYSGAFGVDAGDIQVDSWWCTPGTGGQKCQPGTTGSSSVTTPTPIVTQYYANQVSYGGHIFAVGIEPVAVREYGSSVVTNPNLYYDRVTRRQPANAIVVNMGSGNVSILDLVGRTIVATVAVGNQPIAVALNAAGTMAYVANYGSGTLSEVNLSTHTVARTATVSAGVQSVAMDPSGNYVWVGGPNFLKEISLSTLAVVATQSLAGTVTSLASSNAQNKLVYTLVSNCCTGSSTYQANELLLSNLTTPASYAHAPATPYASYTMNGTLPSAANIPHATFVSAQFGNAFAASATPTGFVIYELVGHQEIMRGTTATPVRGIASDPNNWEAYFAVPDGNQLITVPLPHN